MRARAGPVFVDAAPGERDKRAGTARVVGHFQLNARETASHFRLTDGVRIQKFLRGNLESVFKPQNVVRRENQVQVGAALVETGHVRVAGKAESVVFEWMKNIPFGQEISFSVHDIPPDQSFFWAFW